jgi:hypothetical protein
MSNWLQRVIKEQAELVEKMDVLKEFIAFGDFDKLPLIHRRLLEKQSAIMDKYFDCLQERIMLGVKEDGK